MKENLLSILPKPIANLMQEVLSDSQWQNKTLIDLVIEDSRSYGFEPEEIVPCLNAAYYSYESVAYPEEIDNDSKLSLVFIVAYRTAFKLLSYGKYKATISESGWMKYEGSSTEG